MIVDPANFLADPVKLQPARRRDAEQHAATIVRISALEQKVAPHKLVRLRSNECTRDMQSLGQSADTQSLRTLQVSDGDDQALLRAGNPEFSAEMRAGHLHAGRDREQITDKRSEPTVRTTVEQAGPRRCRRQNKCSGLRHYGRAAFARASPRQSPARG